MTITYEKNYRKMAEGPDWELMSDTGRKDSLVVHALEKEAINNTPMCFSGMYQLLKSKYSRRSEKSMCGIYDCGLSVDVYAGKSTVFPRFFIRKIVKNPTE